MQFAAGLAVVIILLAPAVGDFTPESADSRDVTSITKSFEDNEGCPVGWTVLHVGTNNPFDENGDGVICKRPSGQWGDGHVGHPIDNVLH